MAPGCRPPPFNPAPSSIRPARDDADERTRDIHLARELNRLAADLAVLDVAERARRQVHRGLESLPAIGALHRDKPRGAASNSGPPGSNTGSSPYSASMVCGSSGSCGLLITRAIYTTPNHSKARHRRATEFAGTNSEPPQAGP